MKRQILNKVFLSFLISYMFVFLIPFGVGYFVYSEAITILTEKVHAAEKITLGNRAEVIDYQLNEFETALKQIGYNKNIRSFLDNQNLYFNGENYYAMVQSKRYINSIVSNNKLVKNISVYSNENNYFLTSEYGTVFDSMDKIPVDTLYGMTQDEFNEIMNTQASKYFFFQNKNTGAQSVLFVMPIILVDIANPEGLVIAEISSISEYINTLDNGFVIRDEEKNILQNNAEVMIKVADEIDLTTFEKEEMEVEIGQQLYYVIKKNSNINSWEFISIVDVNNYLYEIIAFKRFVALFAILIFIVGTILTVIISRRKYKPIEKLKTIVSAIKTNTNYENKNDFQMIEDSISRMMETMDTYKIYLSKQERKNMNLFISKIIRGWRIDDEHDLNADKIKIMQKEIEEKKNLVLTYQIDDFSNLFYESDMNYSDEETAKLIDFIIMNVCEEFFGELATMHVQSFDNRFVIIILAQNVNKDYFQRIQKKVEMVKTFFETKIGIIGSFAISSVHEKQYGIKLGYDNTIELLEYMSMIGEQNKIRVYDDFIKDEGNACLKFSIEKEKVFVNFILIEDFESAKRAILELLEEDMKDVKSLQILKVKLFGMIDKMMYALMGISEKSDYFNSVGQEEIDQLLNATSIPELNKSIEKVFSKIIEQKKENTENNENTGKIQQIIEYIHLSYQNPNITVVDIADNFNFSASNLSKLMKKELGQSTLDYLHSLRIKETKKLLIETDLTLAEIAEKVGYYNYRTLVSRFKKLEGITPTQYREQNLD